MSVFVVVASTETEKLQRTIQGAFPSPKSYAYTPSTTFVEFDGTAPELSDHLGLALGKLGPQGVAVQVTQYSGWATKALWDWLAPRTNRTSSVG